MNEYTKLAIKEILTNNGSRGMVRQAARRNLLQLLNEVPDCQYLDFDWLEASTAGFTAGYEQALKDHRTIKPQSH